MSKRIPQRMCVGCREMKDKTEMIRIVRTPEGEIIADPTGKKNGRGAYICKNAECLEAAIKNHGLEKSFKCGIPKDAAAELEKEMRAIAE